MTIPLRLYDRNALVTGASSGIGRAIAIRFAREGACVALNYNGSRENAEATLHHVREASKAAGRAEAKHVIIRADVGDEKEASRLVEETVRTLGRLDMLVNNAGIQRESPSESAPIAELRRVLDVNLVGAAVCSQAAIRHFLSRAGGGVIVNCSSVHEIVPKPGFLGYSMSKGGLANLTRTLALEYADRHIRVNAVGPGAIDTPINAAWTRDPEKRRNVERHIPMGRVGSPEEIAAVFAFLASEEAAYITGQTIFACGGLTLYGDFKQNWSS